MDILYYSNYCKHSQKVIKFLSKGGLTNEVNAFCIDKRTKDPKTNQTVILLEDGKKALLPPNLQSVPALLLINDNYKLILGDDIIKHFEPMMKEKLASADFGSGEPIGFAMQDFSGTTKSNIVSEQFTYYNLTPEELSAKGVGGRRQMHNYVTAKQDQMFIETPPDEYRPNKLDESVTVDKLQQQRNMDVPVSNAPQFQYKTMDL
jgi:hypothetical protein